MTNHPGAAWRGLLLLLGSSANWNKRRRHEPDSRCKYIHITYSAWVPFMSVSKFGGWGSLSRFAFFAHAQAHRAGGFRSDERPSVLLSTRTDWRTVTLAFRTRTSSPCPLPGGFPHGRMKCERFRETSADARHSGFSKMPTGRRRGRCREQQQTDAPFYRPNKD